MINVRALLAYYTQSSAKSSLWRLQHLLSHEVECPQMPRLDAGKAELVQLDPCAHKLFRCAAGVPSWEGIYPVSGSRRTIS